jgi:hypothetical protein
MVALSIYRCYVIEFITYTIKFINKSKKEEHVQDLNTKIKVCYIYIYKNNILIVTASIDLYSICLNVASFQRRMYPLAFVA